MAKDASPKTDAMRKAREEAWEARNASNRAALKTAKQNHEAMATHTRGPTSPAAASPTSSRSGAVGASTGTSSPRSTAPKRSGGRSNVDGASPEPEAGSAPPTPPWDSEGVARNTESMVRADATATKRAAALAALSQPKRVPGPDEGICSGCGKIRALRAGKIAHHQKGLGKKCPGAGEDPV